jgi:hypothetical protein
MEDFGFGELVLVGSFPVSMSGERTKQDNAMGIDNASGVAKAYDFERMNSLLVSKAGSLENVENKLVGLVSKWHQAKPPVEELVRYATTFDVRGLNDEFAIAERLAAIEAPDSLRFGNQPRRNRSTAHWRTIARLPATTERLPHPGEPCLGSASLPALPLRSARANPPCAGAAARR